MAELDPIEREILDKTFTFPQGIPGFPTLHRFVFSQEEGHRPFTVMRSVEDVNVAFVVIEAFYLKPDYVMDVDDIELEPIGSPGPLDCVILFIIRLESGKPFRIHANLRAPLVLHKEKKLGSQIVLHDARYSEQETFEF
ncbi:flagellar assembly factor FliW [Verrucomicrobium sp. GAS474]|uniref:flagellar assembly protein FliW n=1 Tax=Verrucomicrobium sp. GAS474 TaxID=1882831 RepID=UPI00087B38E8|nr:flagellar assembly protein FliW [Verrucomicrobium sp. GAS474]SDU24550.1 flagellar assembly factor FliW [Verrucomicrobium sp. GAS474]